MPGVSLVAEVEGRVIGHIYFNPVTFDPPLDIIAYGLGPLAVVPGHEKHAVGRRLVQNGLAEWLALWFDNTLALTTHEL